MAKTQEQKKKRKKQLTIFEQIQEETAIQNVTEVTKALEELEKQGTKLTFKSAPDARVQKLSEQKAQAEICGHTWECYRQATSVPTAAGKNA